MKTWLLLLSSSVSSSNTTVDIRGFDHYVAPILYPTYEQTSLLQWNFQVLKGKDLSLICCIFHTPFPTLVQ